MVDATASPLDRRKRKDPATEVVGRRQAIAAVVSTDFDTYANACRNTSFSPAQDPDWIGAWVRNVPTDALFICIDRNGSSAIALALCVEQSGPFKIARFIGGPHANGNFPPVSVSKMPDDECVAEIVRALRAERPDIDVLALERLVPEWGGVRNPLLALPHSISPNIALAADLSNGFDALVDKFSGAKRRKRHRYQTRKLQAIGALEHRRADTADEAARLMSAFVAMKRDRLKRLGVGNMFADEPIQRFFEDLFGRAADSAPPKYFIEALLVGGTPRAITGSSRSGKRIICDFAAVLDDELAPHSPGDYLFYLSLEAASRDRMTVYDFSVGDEPYKRSWCDIETQQWDVWAPLTARGRMLARLLAAKSRLKALIKRSPLLWRTLKSIRSRLSR